MNNNYENKILDAIQTLVDNAVTKAGYDKTIKAVISKCVNENTGKYVVKYQDSTFYAYSNDLDSVYSGGTPVYVLVPGNDMSQTKTILGSVDKLGTEYISLSESNAAYQEIGTSIVTPNGTIPGISSYKAGGDSETIYDRTAGSNPVIVDTEGANIYFQNAQYIEIGGTFTTKLNEEQKRQGNYGLVFDIDFKDGETITNKKFVLDIDSMTGNPYSYSFGSEQTAIYEFDGAHFYRLNSITLEGKNFPHSASPYTDDIFVEDIILKGLTPLTRDELATNSLTFITKQGIYFSEIDSASASKKIETEVKINRRVVPSNSGLLRYYWFKEDSTVGLTSADYSPYGGPGWKCLNAYNVIDETNNIRDYLTDADSLTVTKSQNLGAQNEYKCVVIYNNEIQVERNIIIYNQASEYTVTIESDQGNYFKYNEGSPTLTCNVSPSGTYTYTWMVTDSSNRTTLLEENENNVRTRVEGNKIYNIDLGTIANFSKFTCSVSDEEENFVGKADIVITNSWDKEDNSYSLVMENADQIFKYNEKGIAPTNQSLEKPIALKPLQFILYDELGHQVDDNKIAVTDVTWYVPKNNTMFKTPVNPPTEEDGYYVYENTKTLSFDILPVYNNKNMNNTIKLAVKYNDRVLNAQSELVFIKEGELGSNGTDFVCRIVPNLASSANAPTYPTFTVNKNVNPVAGDMNYVRPSGQSDKWFKVQLYKDGVQIYDGITSGTSQENKAVTVAWSILKNKYSSTVSDVSNFSVNSSTGAFEYVDLASGQDRAANIAKVTVTYDGATYYATMPIILVQALNTTGHTYKIELMANTGFRYVMYSTDGLNPLYDSSNPFEVKVYDGDTDITDGTTTHYSWSQLGKIYNGTTWVAQNNLIPKSAFSDSVNANCRPVEKFDGLSVNNALQCVASVSGSEVARIYLPIHFYLNRYGNAALNGWDGNHVEINSNGGFILAPQIGAGKKENDNSYTGVFMGTVREAGSSNEEVGLFGYNKGERTIALDAEDGSARFGKSGQGQIVIDPGADSAKIYSDDFRVDYTTPSQMNPPQTVYTEGFKYIRIKTNGDIILLKQKPAGTSELADDEYRIGDSFKAGDRVWVNGDGLEIDLNDPHILFGNGNFRVDSDGQVYATGFVTVKELEEGDYNIPGVNVFNVDYTNDTVQFEANAQLYPIGTNPIQKTITLNCLYKDETTTNYTTYLLDSNGDPITTYPYPSASTYDANGLRINITQASVAGQAVVTFIANTSQAITNVVNSYKFRFTHPHSPESIVVDKLFYANLVVKGTSVSIKGGPYANVAALCTAHPSGNTLGDSYTVGEENAHLYVFTNGNNTGGAQAGDWSDVGQIQGAPGEDGADAKGLYISASTNIFKKESDASSYSPSSITITPLFQNTTFNKWYYSQDGGANYIEINLSSPPTGITYNSNSKALTIANNCSLYTNNVSVLTFKCVVTETYATSQPYYNTISIGRVDDGATGAPGIDGRTIWVTSTAPTYSNSKYTMSIANLVGPDKIPEVGEIIIYNNRYQYPITTVNTTTVEATTQYDMQGPQGNNTAVVSIYKRNNGQPSTPAYSSSDDPTYTFSTHTLSVAPTGWSTTMPAATTGTELWVSSIVVYGNTDLIDIDTNITWATPTQITEKGMDGTSPFYAYLTNEVQSFAADVVGTTATTDLYAYSGSTQKNIQIISVGGTASPSTSTYQQITPSWLEYKVSSTSSASSVTITFRTKSAPPQSTSGQIAIVYLVAGESTNRTIYFTYATTTKGKDALGLNIEPSALLFKTADGGTTYEPTSITLTPNPQNTTFGSWYYNGTQITTTGSGSATNINGVSLNTSTNVLTIVPTSTEFNSYQSLTFEGRNSDGTIKDRATITRLANANNMWVRYSIDEPTQDSDMQTTPTSSTKYIGVYNGPSETAPTHYTDYVWSKYIGESGNGINSITYKYKATDSQQQPEASSTGWQNNIANTTFSATNKFLWQKEVIDYTLITDKTTVSLIAVWGEKGADTINVILTNESQSIAGDTEKAIPGRSYYTDVKGYLGNTLQTITIGSITSTQGLPTGMNVNITNNNTDHPRVTFTIDNNTAMNTADGQITIPVTLNQTSVDKVFSYSLSLKGEDGDDGDDGNNTATIYLYTRASSAPSKPYSSGTVTYTFASQTLSGTLPSGWSRTVPTGTNPLYVSSVSVTANTATVDIGYDSWSTPTKMAQDGTDGYNTATISIYQRAATQPSVSYSGNKTYTFSSHTLDSLPSGWSATAPVADGNPLWVSYASVSSRNSTATIASSAWSTVVKIAEDGEPGENGYNTATISFYGRFENGPEDYPYLDDVTYTFETQELSDDPEEGWYRNIEDIPVEDWNYPLCVSSVTVSANTATVTIDAEDWLEPALVSYNGENGESAISLTIEALGSTVFRNSQGSLTLVAHVYVGATEQEIIDTGDDKGWCVDESLGFVQWYKNGVAWQVDKSVTISASDINNLAYITCKLESYGS